jgi:membrane-associated phospholipid phosphatase
VKTLLYDWGGLNAWLFYLVNGVHGPWLDRVMLLGTRLGDHGRFPLYLALICLSALYSIQRRSWSQPREGPERAAVWLAVLAVLSLSYLMEGWLIGWLKPWLDFRRPLAALPAGSVVLVGGAELHHSLPSGHAAFAMLIAASLWPILRRAGRIMAVVFVAWVGLSRISVGAHFPADVLAGYLLSLAMALGVRALVTRLLVADSPGLTGTGDPPTRNKID